MNVIYCTRCKLIQKKAKRLQLCQQLYKAVQMHSSTLSSMITVLTLAYVHNIIVNMLSPAYVVPATKVELRLIGVFLQVFGQNANC